MTAKKILAVLLAMALCFGLIACAGTEAKPTTAPTKPQATKPQATQPQDTLPPTEPAEEWVEVSMGIKFRADLAAGKNVKLMADLELENDATIPIDAVKAKLDLNGHTLTFVNKKYNEHFITVMNGEASLTILDSSEAQTGTVKIIVKEDGIASHVFRVNSVNTITVEGGTFIYEFAEGVTDSSNKRNIIHSNGTTIINGGTFINNVGGATVNNYEGTMTLNGGKFNSVPTIVADKATMVGNIVGPDAEGFFTVEAAN